MKYCRFVPVCLVLSVAAALSAQTPTFSTPKQMPSNIPDNWYSGVFLTGNFNGNGNNDLLVGVENPTTDIYTLEFLSGNGSGAFTQTGTVTAPILSNSVVGDFNGDGKDDLISLTPGCEESPCENWPDEGNDDGVFTVWLSQGNGKFTQGYVGTTPAHDDVVEGLVADFNKDGKPDVAVLALPGGNSYYSANPYLCIFLNHGDGTFTQTDYELPVDLSSGPPAATNLVAGDFEGNGNLDLAFAYDSSLGTPTPDPELLTFAGDGKGDFGPAVISYTFDTVVNREYTTSISNVYGPSLFASDLNGDGRTDLVVSIGPYGPAGAPSEVTLLADTQGRFLFCCSVSLDRSVQNILLSDVNGDGHPDLVFIGNKSSSGVSSEYAGIYLGRTGAFETPHIPLSVPGTGPQPFITAVPFKPGALPNLFVSGAKSVALMYINTTK